MRQLIRWTARLYPAQWRDRYGEELDALVEDIQPQWQDLLNVLLGALRMQMTMWNSLKIVSAVALAGALVAGVFAFRTQDRYVSTAVMRNARGDWIASPDCNSRFCAPEPWGDDYATRIQSLSGRSQKDASGKGR